MFENLTAGGSRNINSLFQKIYFKKENGVPFSEVLSTHIWSTKFWSYFFNSLRIFNKTDTKNIKKTKLVKQYSAKII